MFEFLDEPFLPKEKVSHVLVAADLDGEIKDALESRGIKPVPSPYSKSLPQYVRFHPDMNCRHLGGNRFAVFKDSENLSPLLSLGAELVLAEPPCKPCYPFDAALNYLPLGKRLICNPDTADRVSLGSFEDNEVISVKQGYCACSVAVLTDSAVITGDGGIRREAQKNGIKVIIANNEKIILKGYGNGFIGGASGLIAPNTVCFTGNTDDIVDISEIKALGFDTVVLKNADMTDVGGIVPIMQVSK